jgi:hypothetical protein
MGGGGSDASDTAGVGWASIVEEEEERERAITEGEEEVEVGGEGERAVEDEAPVFENPMRRGRQAQA